MSNDGWTGDGGPEHGAVDVHDMAAVPPPVRRRIGELLIDAGVLDRENIGRVAAERAPDERFGQTVVRLGLATEEAVADAIAAQLRLRHVDLQREPPDPVAVARVPRRLCERHGVLPLRVDDGTLTVATADPSDVAALDDIRMAARVRTVRPLVATPSALAAALRQTYRQDATDELLEGLDTVAAPEEGDLELAEEATEPVVRLVESLLIEAVASRASDVHVEPDRGGLRVRLRIDGMLRERTRIPRALAAQVVSRLKILSRLDIAERRLPQDGRALLRVEGREVDLRVATMPTLHGETVVLRLLAEGARHTSLDGLGFTAAVADRFTEALGRPQGLVLVMGPTGSGKTSTLYAGLEAVADPTRNVLTLEDPIEYQLPGINQTQVEPKIGLTFARGLRHVLRQDPDVVLVGEIRDEETAQLATEASFTGHLVLATLHTNDAPSAVARLVDLGADRFLVASSLILVLAQRLVPRVCPTCAVSAEPDPGVLRRLGLPPDALVDATPRRGAGCPACEHTGTLGRIAVAEALSVSTRLRELITEGATETAIARLARLEGMRPMREDAVDRAAAGVTTYEEALRATPEPSADLARCPSCASVVADDHIACPMCGHELGSRHCPGCGRAVEDAWTTCPWCRHRVGAVAAGPDGPAR